MPSMSTRRGIGILGSVTAALLMMAGPGLANPAGGVFVDGDIEIDPAGSGIPNIVVDLGGTPADPCGFGTLPPTEIFVELTDPGAIDDYDSEVVGGNFQTMQLEADLGQGVQTFLLTAEVSDEPGGDNTGFMNETGTPGAYQFAQAVIFEGDIVRVDTSNDCEPTSTPAECHVFLQLFTDGIYVDTGNILPTLSGTATVDGSGFVVTGDCDAPLTSLDGADVTLTDIVVDF